MRWNNVDSSSSFLYWTKFVPGAEISNASASSGASKTNHYLAWLNTGIAPGREFDLLIDVVPARLGLLLIENYGNKL